MDISALSDDDMEAEEEDDDQPISLCVNGSIIKTAEWYQVATVQDLDELTAASFVAKTRVGDLYAWRSRRVLGPSH